MVRLTADSAGSLVAEQAMTSPAVYLDHWALRTIADDPAMCTRFVAALRSRGGTFVLSWLNLLEFSRVGDPTHALSAERLIDAALPDIFLIEVNPWRVIANEDQLLAGRPPITPHADLELLRALCQLKPHSLAPLTAHDLVTVAGEPMLAHRHEQMGKAFIANVQRLRDAADRDPRKVKRRAAPTLPDAPSTRYILAELVRRFVRDRRLVPTENHGIDLVHTVVPSAYCDVVLLDKHWRAQIHAVSRRVRKGGVQAQVAVAPAISAGRVDSFLCQLERGDI